MSVGQREKRFCKNADVGTYRGDGRARTRKVGARGRTRAHRAVGSAKRGTTMAENVHDAVVNYIAKTRFPFPGQKTWASDYRTLTNVPARKHGIRFPAASTFPISSFSTGRVACARLAKLK